MKTEDNDDVDIDVARSLEKVTAHAIAAELADELRAEIGDVSLELAFKHLPAVPSVHEVRTLVSFRQLCLACAAFVCYPRGSEEATPRMRTISKTADPGALDLTNLSRDLTAWRRTHRPPSPIPQCLWERAAAIAASRGVSTVARELRLNATQIKKHMEALPRSQQRPSQGQTATFIEILPLSAPGVIGECAVEIDSPRGSRVRMVMKSVPSTCIADILREFAG